MNGAEDGEVVDEEDQNDEVEMEQQEGREGRNIKRRISVVTPRVLVFLQGDDHQNGADSLATSAAPAA